MTNLFRNKYLIPSTRLAGYDYCQSGYYFITICAKNRLCYFGDIVGDEMILNDMGEIAIKYWLEIPKHFNNVILDEFIVMPNHVHGIVIINGNNNCRDAINRVSTDNDNMRGGVTKQFNPMGKGALGEIIRWYKGRCSFEINKIYQNHYFAWQPRFYDHIIRNETPFHNIQQYIINNPLTWDRDRNNPEGLVM